MCTHTWDGPGYSSTPQGQPGLGPGPRLLAAMVATAAEAAVLASGQRDLQISGIGFLLHLLRGYYVSGPVFDGNSSYASLEVGRNGVFLNTFLSH